MIDKILLFSLLCLYCPGPRSVSTAPERIVTHERIAAPVNIIFDSDMGPDYE
jgi:hypothetical protein